MASAATQAAVNIAVGQRDMTKSSAAAALRGTGQTLMNTRELRAQIDDFLSGTAGFTGVALRILRACAAAQGDGAMDAARAAARNSIEACHEDAARGTFTEGGDFVPVYRREFDDARHASLERKAGERLEWTYFGGPPPLYYTELRAAAVGDAATSPFTLLGLWMPHLLSQIPRVVGETAKQASRPIGTHGLPLGSFGEAVAAFLNDTIPATLGALVSDAMQSVFRIEAYVVLLKDSGGIAVTPQTSAALAVETAKVPGYLQGITMNLSLGQPTPRTAAIALIDTDEFRAQMRTEQVAGVTLDVSDDPWRYMVQLDEAFRAHVLLGNGSREALFPGCRLVETDGRRHLALDSDDPGAPNDGAWQALVTAEGMMQRAGWHGQAAFSATMEAFASACLEANKGVSSQNKELFTADFIASTVEAAVTQQRAAGNLMPIVRYVTRALNTAAQTGAARVPSAEAAAADTGAPASAAATTDGAQREIVRKGATGREWLEDLSASLTAPERATLAITQQDQQDALDQGADMRARVDDLQQRKSDGTISRSEEGELDTLKTFSVPRSLQRIAIASDAVKRAGPSDTQLATVREAAKQAETVDGIVATLRTKRVAGEALSAQEVRVLDEVPKLRELFGTGRIKTVRGQSPLAVLDASISDHGRRNKSYALSTKETDSRNRKVGLNWATHTENIHKSRAVYLSGRTHANAKLFHQR
jgi:hypothetical protein